MRRLAWFAGLVALVVAICCPPPKPGPHALLDGVAGALVQSAHAQGLPFPGPGLGYVQPLNTDNVTLTGGAGGTSSGRTYNGVKIGRAAANRTIIVFDGFRENGTETVTGMTIGGVTATLIAQRINLGTFETTMNVWAAAVPTGTTATIVTTYSASVDSAEGLGVYAAYGLPTITPYSSASSTSTTVGSVNLNVPASGIVIAGAWGGGQSAPMCTWAGATADYAMITDPTSSSQLQSGASAQNVSVANPRTVSCTFGATSTIDTVTLAVSFLSATSPIPTMAFQGSNTPGAFQSSISTFTFTSQPIGSAAANRSVIYAVCMRTVLTNTTVSTSTVNGVSATLIKAQDTGSTNGNYCSIWIATVASGTSVSFVINLNQTDTVAPSLFIWSAYGLNANTAWSTPSASSSASSQTLGVNTIDSAVVVAASSASAASTPSIAWTGLTGEGSLTNSAGTTSTGADASSVVTAAPRTITATVTGGSLEASGVAAAFR